VRRRQVKVEALGITAEDVLRRFGMRNQLISTFKSLDVWIDPSGSLDESFWGILVSELGRRGLNQEFLPRRGTDSIDSPASIFLLRGERFDDLLSALSAAVSHWLEVRGRDAWIALDAYVQKGDGMERLQIRGSLGDALDAMRAWGSGLLSAR